MRCLQTSRKSNSIPNGSQETRQVQQATRTMQFSKLLIQRNHLLAMRRRIIALLSISALLALALSHDFGGGWTDDGEVEEGGDEDCKEWVEDCAA